MADCNSCPSKGNCNSQSNCSIENNPNNKFGKIIGVMNGKGGVGKSTVTALLANKLNKMGYKVGILDSDITGPSIPRLMGVKNVKAYSDGSYIYPVENSNNIKVMSINLMIDDENEPVVWRGPLLGGVVKQFYTDVLWEELDYLLIDMPPGTGDVALTVMQSIPISGIVMVSVPQDLVSMIVSKAVNMAKKMNINVLGVIENMSYIQCPDCSKKIKLFEGESTEKFLDDLDLELLGELPMTKEIIDITHNGVTEISDDLDSILTNVVEKIK
ncbi:sodium:proton antiporter [Clostridioides difficile]|uniref:Mrp/NBP35 family ATP-binding protein n=1 Tax=Clostridioides difficile TaxID=1496 RepID=UPI000BB1C4EB|nr:Mrp/NBP35 family ATP-binding protein [Clostridioides difficile]PBG19969.1 sodium:proton antiporter [Clostridioides difficile]